VSNIHVHFRVHQVPTDAQLVKAECANTAAFFKMLHLRGGAQAVQDWLRLQTSVHSGAANAAAAQGAQGADKSTDVSKKKSTKEKGGKDKGGGKGKGEKGGNTSPRGVGVGGEGEVKDPYSPFRSRRHLSDQLDKFLDLLVRHS
jgi:hypothetical protein